MNVQDTDLVHVQPSGPAATGALASRAVVAGGLVYATVIPRREDGSIETGNVNDQTEQIFANLDAVLSQAGSSMDRLVHLTIYLTDMADRVAFNHVYERTVPLPFPSRCAVEVSALAVEGIKVEVTAVALYER
jgi:enamine deaminase RidA (YjgF/YER057c/UK114 family)